MSGHARERVPCAVCCLAVLSPVLLSGAPIAAQQTTSYGYDALGRLTSVSSPQATTAYRYDAAGNRQQVTVQAGAPTTLNGDFEQPQVGTYAYAPSAPDLVFSGQAGIAHNGSDWAFPQPWHGSQVAFLQASSSGTGAIDMRAIRLVVGRRYRFAFAASQRPGYQANTLRVFVNGALVWEAVPPGTDRFTAEATPTFVAAQSTTTIRFESSPTSYDSASGIDQVSIQPQD